MNRQELIAAVSKKTGYSPKEVDQVLENLSQGVIEFMTEKKGYNVLWPGLGTFTFRVTTVAKQVEAKRFQLATWLWKLPKLSGEYKHDCEFKINRLKADIRQLLLIKKEYLEEFTNDTHYKYRSKILHEHPQYDISRLDELLDVSVIINQIEIADKQQKEDL